MDLSQLKYRDEIYFTGELRNVGRVERFPCVITENCYFAREPNGNEFRQFIAWPFDRDDHRLSAIDGCCRFVEFSSENVEAIEPINDSPKKTLNLFDLSPFSPNGQNVYLTATIRDCGRFQMAVEWDQEMSLRDAISKSRIIRLVDKSFDLIDYPCSLWFSAKNPTCVLAGRLKTSPPLPGNYSLKASRLRIDLSDVRKIVLEMKGGHSR